MNGAMKPLECTNPCDRCGKRPTVWQRARDYLISCADTTCRREATGESVRGAVTAWNVMVGEEAYTKHVGAITLNLGATRPTPPVATPAAIASATSAANPQLLGHPITNVERDVAARGWIVTVMRGLTAWNEWVADRLVEQHAESFCFPPGLTVTHVQWGADILREHEVSKPPAKAPSITPIPTPCCGKPPAQELLDAGIGVWALSCTVCSARAASGTFDGCVRRWNESQPKAHAIEQLNRDVLNGKLALIRGVDWSESYLDEARDCTSTLEAAARAKEPDATTMGVVTQLERILEGRSRRTSRTARDTRCPVTIFVDNGEE